METTPKKEGVSTNAENLLIVVLALCRDAKYIVSLSMVVHKV
jgi:hypothetical protein